MAVRYGGGHGDPAHDKACGTSVQQLAGFRLQDVNYGSAEGEELKNLAQGLYVRPGRHARLEHAQSQPARSRCCASPIP